MKNVRNYPGHAVILVAGLLVAATPGCAPNIDMRGNLPHSEQLVQVKVGQSRRDDVQQLLGTPSNVSPFGDESWHYISARTENFAFFEPAVKERKVVTITFNRSGVVKAIDARGMEDGKQIETVDRETPTAGKEMSVLQQLIGNVGRFSKDPAGK